jgi:zinc protease
MAVANTLYMVGSRDENPERTGFAHLFEHLMFGGSRHAPDFDGTLQQVGGDNNAFTNTDFTNYYITLPAGNLETALWLESDRMMALNISERTLDIQRKVVVEEFKQRYLNQPYGDAWLLMRPLAYRVHPYRWATIGRSMAHIEEATLEDVRDFYTRFYHPGNAVLVVAGNVRAGEVVDMTRTWFGDIPCRPAVDKAFPQEPEMDAPRTQTVEADVPQHAIYKAYHMPGRQSSSYYAADLLSELLGRGKSSVLYEKLVKEDRVFSSVSAYVTGTFDPGLLVVSGRVDDGYSIEAAHDKLLKVLGDFVESPLQEGQIEKARNQMESTLVFGEAELLNRAIGLAVGEALGNANLVNEELEIIKKLRPDDVEASKVRVLREVNCSTLLYQSNK